MASRRAKNFLDRLASVPADPEDARAFFQRRLRAFARILGVLWIATWPVDYVITLVVSSQPFLAINGIQTMSAQTYNLLAEVPEMRQMGIDILRLSPQAHYMDEIIAAFDAARRGDKPLPVRREWASEGFVDGYWFGKPGIHAVMNYDEAL